MKALILANGDPPPRDFLRRLVSEHDLFLVVDGAAHRAAALGLSPDLVSGDFDSVRLEEARQAFPHAEFVHTPDQDRADLEKAILLARKRGAARLTLTGATGGRIDHTLGNVSLLRRYSADIPLAIVAEGSELRALSGTEEAPGEWSLDASPGDTVSLLALDEGVRATIQGVRWPLNNEPLPVGTHGLSNEAVSSRVLVQARGGALLACHLNAAERRR